MILLASVEWTVAGLCLASGLFGGFLLWRGFDRRARRAFAAHERELMERARREAESVVREARVAAEEQNLQRRRELEEEWRRRRAEVESAEARVAQGEAMLRLETQQVAERERTMEGERRMLEEQRARLAGQERELTWCGRCSRRRRRMPPT
jgi:hypothetical protein